MCQYFLPSCPEKSWFAKCIYTGQKQQGEGCYLKGVFIPLAFWSLEAASSDTLLPVHHWAHLQVLWLYYHSRAALSFWEAGAEGSMAEWSRAMKCPDIEGLFTWEREDEHKALYAL